SGCQRSILWQAVHRVSQLCQRIRRRSDRTTSRILYDGCLCQLYINGGRQNANANFCQREKYHQRYLSRFTAQPGKFRNLPRRIPGNHRRNTSQDLTVVFIDSLSSIPMSENIKSYIGDRNGFTVCILHTDLREVECLCVDKIPC